MIEKLYSYIDLVKQHKNNRTLTWHAQIQKVLSEGSNSDVVFFCFVLFFS